MITFGQYNTLYATRQCVTINQLCVKTEFQKMMVRYYIAVLLDSGLIEANHDPAENETCYQLTEAGISCLDEYERHNPELTIARSINQIRNNDQFN